MLGLRYALEELRAPDLGQCAAQFQVFWNHLRIARRLQAASDFRPQPERSVRNRHAGVSHSGTLKSPLDSRRPDLIVPESGRFCLSSSENPQLLTGRSLRNILSVFGQSRIKFIVAFLAVSFPVLDPMKSRT